MARNPLDVADVSHDPRGGSDSNTTVRAGSPDPARTSPTRVPLHVNLQPTQLGHIGRLRQHPVRTG